MCYILLRTAPAQFELQTYTLTWDHLSFILKANVLLNLGYERGTNNTRINRGIGTTKQAYVGPDCRFAPITHISVFSCLIEYGCDCPVVLHAEDVTHLYFMQCLSSHLAVVWLYSEHYKIWCSVPDCLIYYRTVSLFGSIDDVWDMWMGHVIQTPANPPTTVILTLTWVWYRSGSTRRGLFSKTSWLN